MSVNTRSRNWFLTINNPTNNDIKALLIMCEEQTKYAIWGLEHVDGGFDPTDGHELQPHIHALLMFRNARYFNAIKQWFPRANIEEARDIARCINYCKKEGCWQNYGEEPGAQRRQRAAQEEEREEIIHRIRARQLTLTDFTDSQMLDQKLVKAAQTCLNYITGPRRDVHIHVFVSETGWGKTTAIYNAFTGVDIGLVDIAGNNEWFINPEAKVMLFDEFCGQIRAQKMLRYLQGFPMSLPIKGGHRPCNWEVIFILSNTPPEQWYAGYTPDGVLKSNIPESVRNALYRRIGYGMFPSTPEISTTIFWEPIYNIDTARTEMQRIADEEYQRLFPH